MARRIVSLLVVMMVLLLSGAIPGHAQEGSQPGPSRLSALSAPQLVAPPTGTILQTMSSISLNWSLPAGATQYQVQITPFNDDGPAVNLIRNAENAFTVSAPVQGSGPYVLLPAMTYTWRVRATDALTGVTESDPGWGAWSEGWTFTTPPASADTIRASQPPVGGTAGSLTPTLIWSDDNPAIFYYEVQLSTDPRFETDPTRATAAVYWNLVHGGVSRPPNSWTVPSTAPLQAAKRYYWRVRPRVQGNGLPAAWGTTNSFTAPGESAGPRADLAVTDVQLSTGIAVSGGQVQMQYTVRNMGPGESKPTDVHAVLSPRATLTTSDRDLGTAGTVGALSSGQSVTQLATVTMPAGLNLGPYYLGIYVDWSDNNKDELNEDNNAAAKPLAVIKSQPVLTVIRSGSGSGTVVSAPPGINCGNVCSATYNEGTVVTLAATAGPGSRFVGWSGPCTGAGSCTVTVNTTQSVTATFEGGQQQILTVAKPGAGGGSVVSTPPGIDCGSVCAASFNDGTEVTLTALPDANSTFTGWGEACSGTGPCTVKMTGSDVIAVTAVFDTVTDSGTPTLTVVKQGSGSGTVASSPGGIDCGQACSQTYVAGSLVTLTATPATGSVFAGWGGSCSGTGTCSITVTGNQTVTAVFNATAQPSSPAQPSPSPSASPSPSPSPQSQSVVLTVSVIGNGSVSSSPTGINCGSAGSSCIQTYSSGTSVTLYASAVSGANFSGWSGACSGYGNCTLTMSQNVSVVATFTNTQTSSGSFFLTVSPSGNGVVTSSPSGISCSMGAGTCSYTFSSGTGVTLYASPSNGATFGAWSGACSGTGTTCYVYMNQNQFVGATFSGGGQGIYTVSVTVTGNGTVTSNPFGINCGVGGSICSQSFATGSSVTLYATAASGATFSNWSGPCSGSSTTCTVYMNQSQYVTATFSGTQQAQQLTWLLRANMPTSRLGLGAVTASNGSIYAIGGGPSPSNANERYNPYNNTWTSMRGMQQARSDLGVAAGSNGRLYAIGGTYGGQYLNTVEEYDPNTDTWVSKQSMPTPRSQLAVATGSNGKIYAIGGYSGGQYLNTVEEYDPNTNSWSVRQPMFYARGGLTAVAANGKIYAIGGFNGSQPLSIVEEYDPNLNSWVVKGSMLSARRGVSAALLNGRIYTLGGENSAAVESYDPVSNTWRTEAPLLRANSAAGAATGGNGKLYVIGGGQGGSPTSDVQEGSFGSSNSNDSSNDSTHDDND